MLILTSQWYPFSPSTTQSIRNEIFMVLGINEIPCHQKILKASNEDYVRKDKFISSDPRKIYESVRWME